MFRQPDRDDVLDALAMIQAAHDCDAEAAGFLMGQADLHQVVAVLAKVAADLLRDLAAVVDEPSGELLAELRTRHSYGIDG
jgi:hypothetical protein